MSSRTKSETVRVISRFRPSNKRENQEWNKYSESKWQNEVEEPCTYSGQTIKVDNPSTGRPYRFTYDDVLWQDSTQVETFQSVAAPVCRNALNGFNGTVFAYGQTGSGKTHTMIGPESKYSAKDSGIVPRAANFFFHAIENSADIETAELKVSFMEVYKGTLRDLNPANGISGPDLKIRQKMNNETFVENLNDTTVNSLGQILKLIQIANSHRTMAATSMNKTSSRSHFIITFYLKLRKVPQAGGHKLSAKVSFIDLAGSEKVKKTGASGQRLKEAQSINAGLSTLSRVIEALAKKRQSIPFRDNALTWILKDSLAGNTKTTLVITCTPHQFNKAETITTCRFGSRCKLIKTHVKSNKELTPQQMKALIKKLQKENTDLKDRLEIGGDNNDNNFNENYQQKISELRDEIDKLKSQPRYDIDSKENEFDEERNELGEKIERLEAEVDNLNTELEISDQEKKNLSVMNALLAEKLDTNISEIQNEQTVSDLFRNDLQHLKNNKDFYISELKELRFETDEIQDIFDNVFDEINKITEELVDREQDLDELEEKLIENETDIEKKNYEITRLSTQLENVDIKNRNEKKNNKNNNNKIGNEEAKYDNDVVATTFVLNL
eukprot:271692_1